MKKTSFTLLFSILAAFAFAQTDNAASIAMMKQNLANSAVSIKKYEWIETTITYLKGEEKSRKQNRCYYDATGKLTKVATGGGTPASDKKGGIRGKIIANKTEDIGDYVKKSIAKIKTYLPPDGAKLQQIYGDGKVSVHVLDPGKKFKFDFPSYNQPGDQLSVALDKANKLINGVSVNTYLDKPDDKVNFDVKYDALPDGTQFPSETNLEAAAKNIKIVIQNSGYKKTAG